MSNAPARSTHARIAGRVFSLDQAAEAAPVLAVLYERVKESERLLGLVRRQLPEPMRQRVWSGPLTDTDWCLLVDSAPVSTKLRQMLPHLLSTLNQNGAKVNAIRIKVQHGQR